MNTNVFTSSRFRLHTLLYHRISDCQEGWGRCQYYQRITGITTLTHLHTNTNLFLDRLKNL